MVKKLIFIGSSHAKRLCWEAYYIETITKFYNIVDFSRPGSLFENLVWPECSTLTKDDIIVFQSFENNLMQRHTYKDWVISHLTKFVPNKLSYLEKIFSQLLDNISVYPCKIYIFDNIYRHLQCCKNHHYKGLIRFQKRANFLLQKTIESRSCHNVRYLDHRQYLGINFRKIWKMSLYKNILQKDGVHLFSHFYNRMMFIFLKRFLLRATATLYTSGPG